MSSTKNLSFRKLNLALRKEQIISSLEIDLKARQDVATELEVETSSLCAAFHQLLSEGVIRVYTRTKCEHTGRTREVLGLVGHSYDLPQAEVQPPKPLRLVTSPREDLKKVIHLNFKAQSQLNEILKYLNGLSSKAAK